MLAKQIQPDYDGKLPVVITIYKTSCQIPHYHKNTFEMIMCLKGSATIYSMHKKHVLYPGDIIQTDMYDMHTVSSDTDNLIVSFHFDLNHPLFAGKGYNLLYYICSSDETDPKHILDINRIRLLLLALLSCYINNRNDNRINDFAVKILAIIRQRFQYYNHINVDETMYPPEMMDRFERIMAFMLEHYSKKITMHDICTNEHISYNYLSSFFKESSLKTFRNFLHEIRVYHSEHLLLCNPDIPVPEIGYMVGFSDPKFFYREFKKKHGHTPHQHRIWYRKYNEMVEADTILDVNKHIDEVEDCITDLFAHITYMIECK